MSFSTPDHVALTILAYHDGAAGYAEHSRDRDHLAHLRRELLERLPERPRILDIGGGPGHDSALLAGTGADVVLLDAASGLLREAGRHASVAPRRVCGEARQLPFADGSFDGIWSCASLLHVPPVDVPVALAEAARVLKRGGIAFFSLSEGDSVDEVPVSDLGLATRAYYYHRGDDWAVMVTGAGFELVEHRVNRTAGNFNPGSTGWIETFARRH